MTEESKQAAAVTSATPPIVHVVEKPEEYNKNLMPITIGHKLRMAKVLVESGLLPNGMNTPQKVCVALQMGHELGLSPMIAINNIAVINGRPAIGTDLLVAIIRRHPEYAGMEIDETKEATTVTFKRRAGIIEEKFSSTFSNEDARVAGLLTKDNWKKYPARMRKHRATAFAARDAFPDAIAGMYTTEEVENIPMKMDADVRDPDDVLFRTIMKTLEAEPDKEKRQQAAMKALQFNPTFNNGQREIITELGGLSHPSEASQANASEAIDGEVVKDTKEEPESL